MRIAAGGANLVLGCDMVVAAGADALSRIEPGVTTAVINGYVHADRAPSSPNGDMDFGAEAMRSAIRDAAGDEATRLRRRAPASPPRCWAIRSPPTSSCWATPGRRAWCRSSLEALERAIELNGVAVETNKRTFDWGRLAAHDLARRAGRAPSRRCASRSRVARTPDGDRRQARRAAHRLPGRRLRRALPRFVEQVRAAEKAARPGRAALAEAVAKSLFKLMAYKDEYEVGAALHRRRVPARSSRRQFEGDYKLNFHLAPPLFAERDPTTGELKKREYGAWMLPAFRLLARLKRLRGTRLDIFGYTEERRMERRLIGEYEATIDSAARHARARTTTRWRCRSPRCRRRSAASATSRRRT